jgi:BolA protein
MNLTEEIKNRLQSLAPSQLEIEDDSASHAGHKGNGGGGHYNLTIVSAEFKGKTQVARHRIIYQLMGDLIPVKIHALSILAIASDE